MKRSLALTILTILTTGYLLAQAPETREIPPQEVVEALWKMAVQGQFLTRKGFDGARRILPKSIPLNGDSTILVVPNYYGVNAVTTTGTTAIVDMEYTDVGQIDSKLRYSAPRSSNAHKTSLRYHLVGFSPGGIGPRQVWQIEDSPEPWTTVNTAIRYVLETREETADPTVKKNADETFSRLLKLHSSHE
jgi:hypothetical protein